MIRIVVICFGLLADFVGAQTEIRLIPAKESLHATIGSNITLACEANGLNGKTVRWDHRGRQIASVAPGTVVFSDPAYKEKYVIGNADGGSGNFSFTLLNYARNDEGDVTCEVARMDPVSIRLETLVLPEIVFMTVDSPHRQTDWNGSQSAIVFNLDHSPSASCIVLNSQPKASIVWTWNSNKTATESLNITETKESSGELHNVSSTIVLPLHYVRPPVIEDVQSNQKANGNVTAVELTELEENFADDDSAEVKVETVNKLAEEIPKTYGLLSCEATVGDRKYVKSQVVHFSDDGNSGIAISLQLTEVLIVSLFALCMIIA